MDTIYTVFIDTAPAFFSCFWFIWELGSRVHRLMRGMRNDQHLPMHRVLVAVITHLRWWKTVRQTPCRKDMNLRFN